MTREPREAMSSKEHSSASSKQRHPIVRETIHIPNDIPLNQRFWSLLGAILLLVWGGHGLLKNDLVLPLRRRADLHLHDESAYLMFAAFVCGALVLLAIVIDHYDRRNNEHHYQRFSRTMSKVGWWLFGSALLLKLILWLRKVFHG